MAALAAATLTAPAALAATTAPSNLQATGVNYTSVALSWSPATGTIVDGYRLLVDGAWRGYSYQPDSGLVTGLLPGRTYSLTVQAQDKSGNVTAASNVLTVSTPADVQAPTVPGNLVDNDPQPESGAFELYWNRSSDNATTQLSYEVYANGQLVQVVSGIGAGVTVCLDPGSYSFTVRARDAAGNLSAPSNTTQ